MPQITIKRPKGYQGLWTNKIGLPASEIISDLTSELNSNLEANELHIECDNIYIAEYAGPGGKNYLKFTSLPQNCVRITKLSLKVESLMADVFGWLLYAMPNLETLQLIDTHLRSGLDPILGWRMLRISNRELLNLKNLILNNVKILTMELNTILLVASGTLEYVTLKINKEDLERLLMIDAKRIHGFPTPIYNLQQQQEPIPALLENGIGYLPSFPNLRELDLSQELLDIILRSQMEKATKPQLNEAVSRKIIADFVNLSLCFKHAQKLPKAELDRASLQPQPQTQLIGIKMPNVMTKKIMSYLYDTNSVPFKLTFPTVTPAQQPIVPSLKNMKI